MASDFEDKGELELRSGSAELRRLAEQEQRLADQSDLPMVRQKHQLAAERWAQMAADRERLQRSASRRAAPEEQHP
jgi:hypothetical protein